MDSLIQQKVGNMFRYGRFDRRPRGSHQGWVSERPPRRFDPVATVRKDLEEARRELGRAQAITGLLAERVAALEEWIAEAERIGIDGETPDIPAFPLLGGLTVPGSAKGASQWDWVRFALLQSPDPAEPKTILARIVAEGGLPIDRASLGSLLRKKQLAGEVEHVGRAWRLLPTAT